MTTTQDTLVKQKIRRLKKNEKRLKQRVDIQVKIIFGQEGLISIQEDELKLRDDIITEQLETITQLRREEIVRPSVENPTPGTPSTPEEPV